VITVAVEYTCYACGIRDRIVNVRERGIDEDILPWMTLVQQDVGDDHARLSPHCTSKKCDLKIPLASKDSRIGEARRQ
jgi:hypothetical protein